MTTIIFFILIFGLVVVAHELGHFLLAKINGIHVVEFSVGMGPTILSFTRKETKYALRLLPIGGACMFEGEDGIQTKDDDAQEDVLKEGTFYYANVWQRISVVAAGPIFNFILAYIIALVIVSVPDINIALPIIGEVVENSPAELAGIQAGDEIVSIGGEKIYLSSEINLFLALHDGTDFPVLVHRGDEEIMLNISPAINEATGGYYMGIISDQFIQNEGLSIFKYAWYEIRSTIKTTYKSLGMLVRGQVEKDDVTGPVGIATIVGDTYESTKEYGWETVALNMLNIVLLLSINLGILNLLPIPALDGGRLVFMLVEIVRGKPISPEKEGVVHFIGFVFFMILMVVVFINDLQKLF